MCCDTIRDRDDIGWFVVYCIQHSQSNIGVSGVTSRVIGEWDNVRSVCIYKKEVTIKSYTGNLEEMRNETHTWGPRIIQAELA